MCKISFEAYSYKCLWPDEHIIMEVISICLTFIDDFSRKTWIYLLKSKDEVFHCFKIFKAFVERQSDRLIKMVRSDGGGVYKSNEFKRHCEELGLQHNITCPYTP